MKKTIVYARITLLITIPLMVIIKINQLNKIDFDLDLLGRQLIPLQSYIKPNCPIGFYTNSKNSTLFVEMQYLMAPQAINDNITPDTLLLIQFNSQPTKKFDHYRIIAQNKDKEREVALITKTN